jgi:hypothetical protein
VSGIDLHRSKVLVGINGSALDSRILTETSVNQILHYKDGDYSRENGGTNQQD